MQIEIKSVFGFVETINIILLFPYYFKILPKIQALISEVRGKSRRFRLTDKYVFLPVIISGVAAIGLHFLDKAL